MRNLFLNSSALLFSAPGADAGPIPEILRRVAPVGAPSTEATGPAPEKALISPKPSNKSKLVAAVKAKKEAKTAAPKAKVVAKTVSAPKTTAAPKAKVEATGTTEDDEGVKLPRSIVPAKFKTAYAAHSNTCGDKLALALKAATTTKNEDGRECLDVAALAVIAKDNGLEIKGYEGLNNGQKRMNVSNKLRGLIKHGTTVVVGKQRFAASGLVKEQAAA